MGIGPVARHALLLASFSSTLGADPVPPPGLKDVSVNQAKVKDLEAPSAEAQRYAILYYVHYRREEFREALDGRGKPTRHAVLTEAMMAALEPKFRVFDAVLREQIRKEQTLKKLAEVTSGLSKSPKELESVEPIISIGFNVAKIRNSAAEVRREVGWVESKDDIVRAEKAFGELRRIASGNVEKAKALATTSEGVSKLADLYSSDLGTLNLTAVYEKVFDCKDEKKLAGVSTSFQGQFAMTDLIYERTCKQVNDMVVKEEPAMRTMAKLLGTIGRVVSVLANKEQQTLSTLASLKEIGTGMYGKSASPANDTLVSQPDKRSR